MSVKNENEIQKTLEEEVVVEENATEMVAVDKEPKKPFITKDMIITGLKYLGALSLGGIVGYFVRGAIDSGNEINEPVFVPEVNFENNSDVEETHE